ncbi:MAG: autotransporter-associated beta strand repeat-containing protein, partial [Verrucomicrobia bacterium]|nr:autotransporter-associated beta strand repeat-containing protein [Verrucomicrobiota bacterium]
MRSSKLPIFIKKFSWTAAFCLATPSLYAVTNLTVSTPGDANVATAGTFSGSSGDLRGVLNHINQNPDTYNVTFALGGSNTITLGAMLPILNLNAANTIALDGTNGGTPIVIDGASTFRGFFARQGNVTLQNLSIQNVKAKGGTGGIGGGGGGMGAGAAIFIDKAAVTLSNLTISSASAIGGAGGANSGGGGGGGGGLGGNGGNGGDGSGVGGFLVGGGGGGIGGAGGNGDNTALGAGGGGGGINCGTNFTGKGGDAPSNNGLTGGGIGGASAGSGLGGGMGGINGGGGGAGGSGPGGGQGGGGGGVGGNSSMSSTGGLGGYGGGGGGNGNASESGQVNDGGFGGGGGGGSESSSDPTGSGGFGGGAGGYALASLGSGGFGGGGGGSAPFDTATVGGVGGGKGGDNSGPGGGGAGFGGAIFVNSGAYNSSSPGSLTILGPFTTSSSGSNTTTAGAAGGAGATVGWSKGNDAFFLTGTAVTFDPNGSTISIFNSIGDDSPASFTGAPSGVTQGTKSGAVLNIGNSANPAGTVTLVTANTYSGGTNLNKGTLKIEDSGSLGTGSVTFATADGNILQAGTSGLNIANSIALSKNGVIDTNGANNSQLSGSISGAGSLTVKGSSTDDLSITNSNNYSGGTILNGPTLFISQNDSLGTGSLTNSALGSTLAPKSSNLIVNNSIILNNGLNVDTNGETFTLNGQISGTADFHKTGGGVLVLTNPGNNYTGGTEINSQTLALALDGTIHTSPTLFIASIGAFDISQSSIEPIIGDLSGDPLAIVNLGSKTLFLGASASTTYSGVIQDGGIGGGAGGSITKQGSSTLTLAGANTYTGTTTINKGTLAAGAVNALSQNSAVTFADDATAILDISGFNNRVASLSGGGSTGGNVTLGSNTLTLGNSITDTSYAGAISGTGGITKVGTAKQTFTGTNSYSGTTQINAGTLAAGATNALSPSSPVSFANVAGAILDISAFDNQIASLAGGGALGGNVTLGANTLTLGNDTSATSYAGAISGTGGINKIGMATQTFTGTNTYTGITLISTGTLKINSVTALPFGGNVGLTGSGSKLDLSGAGGAMTIGDLTGGNPGAIVDAGTNNLTFGTATPTATFFGNIQGSGNLTKQNAGTVILNGVNAFSGPTDVTGGTLIVNGSLASSPMTVEAGATLGGTGTTGDVTLKGSVSPGNSIGTMNTGAFTFNSGSNYLVELSNAASDVIAATGVVTINPGATLNLASVGLTSPLSSYTIITSTMPLVGSGNFTLVNPFPRFNFAVQYDPTDVMLVLQSMVNFSAKGNAGAVVKCFNTLIGSPDPTLAAVVNVLDAQTMSEWQHSFNQMQPANFNNIAFAQENVAERIRQNFSAHLFEQRVESCPDQKPWRVWLAPFYEHAHQRGEGSNKGYKENFRGFTTAID